MINSANTEILMKDTSKPVAQPLPYQRSTTVSLETNPLILGDLQTNIMLQLHCIHSQFQLTHYVKQKQPCSCCMTCNQKNKGCMATSEKRECRSCVFSHVLTWRVEFKLCFCSTGLFVVLYSRDLCSLQ